MEREVSREIVRFHNYGGVNLAATTPNFVFQGFRPMAPSASRSARRNTAAECDPPATRFSDYLGAAEAGSAMEAGWEPGCSWKYSSLMYP